MRPLLLLFIFVLTIQNVRAEDAWFNGSVTLRSQSRLRGEISIRPDYNVVLFRRGGEVMVYPAYKVESLDIYDNVLEQNRIFISLEQGIGAATVYQLYEIVVEGEISVLRRQRTHWYSIHLDVEEYDYFVQKDEVVYTLQKFKRRVFPTLLKSDEGILKEHMREKKLTIHRMSDLIQIITFFNQQKMSGTQLAKRG